MSAVIQRNSPSIRRTPTLVVGDDGPHHVTASHDLAPLLVPVVVTMPRTKAGLTDTALRALKPQAKPYKVTDGKGT